PPPPQGAGGPFVFLAAIPQKKIRPTPADIFLGRTLPSSVFIGNLTALRRFRPPPRPAEHPGLFPVNRNAGLHLDVLNTRRIVMRTGGLVSLMRKQERKT
ncbi:MAG TPA: hypothetical protein VFQ91_23780, partial [Bryobacteraceae bacterium]|nr:hypothetical protein [Bryobacteraceae bacterium]